MAKKSLQQKREEKRREQVGHLQAYMEDFIKRGFSMVPTTDSWYPNFPGDLVAVGLVERQTEYAVYVTGADDFAMEYITTDKGEAKRILKELPAIISVKDLKERGFVNG